jgi:hypothetical protein
MIARHARPIGVQRVLDRVLVSTAVTVAIALVLTVAWLDGRI